MSTASSPRLIANPDGTFDVEPSDAWWCAHCGHLAVVDDRGLCERCASGRRRRCSECGRRASLNDWGRCKPCAATERAEARRITDLVMAALE